MKASVVKYFYRLGYSMRQTAIISEVSEDYVRKIMSGKRAQGIAADDTEVTEGMRRRAKVIDYIMSLKGADFVESVDRYSYISLLSYMGFTLDELHLIFPNNDYSFIGIAALRSGEAWKRFDATVLGLPQEDFNFTFIDKVATYEAKQTENDNSDKTYLEKKQNSRRANKLKNRELAQKNGAKN